jgi:hypothetical protein
MSDPECLNAFIKYAARGKVASKVSCFIVCFYVPARAGMLISTFLTVSDSS